MRSNNNDCSLFKASSCDHHLRIADVLLLEDEEEVDDGGDLQLLLMDGRKKGSCGIVSRWLRCFGRANGLQRDEDEEDATDVKVINGGDLSPPVTQNDHQSGKNELDKMMELRIHMQMLFQNFKEELQVRNTSEVMGSNTHGPRQNLAGPYVQPESLTTLMACDESLKCDTPKDIKCLEGIDQLQAEFEAELEHLQLHWDKEKPLQHPEQQSTQVAVKETAYSECYSMSSEEVINPVIEPQEAFIESEYGVSPYELERRLHEVLEARQQEHIRELEAALECAKHKLHEKEMEISWWRDTARLFSQRVSRPSRLISERV